MRSLSLLLTFLELLISSTTSYQPSNVWSTFGGLAKATNSVNLGQGFPDWAPPLFLLDALQTSSFHQYTRPAGHVPLVELLAERYSKHLRRDLHPFDEVAVTVGIHTFLSTVANLY
jgi:kynurenine--oxoglutarate transaminase/cysteine-S-conjugate beta-lyase/glutamine--phenylpyruvate transaminase